MSTVHPAAAQGFSDGAETYARGRPDFPPQALDWLRNDLELGPGSRLIDLGAGTGKFTRLLSQTGAEVIAVDPVPAMLGQLTSFLPGVAALRAGAQALPFADQVLDAVVCAQSFHWFAHPAVLQEIRRVLRPGGVLGLIWNVRDQSVDWVAALTRIMAPFEGDAPRYDSAEWRRVFPAPGFGSLQERHFHHEHVGSAERVIVDRVASVSFIAALAPRAQARVLREVRALVAQTPSIAGRDEVRFPYITRVYWTRRT